jgi:hypothetical protein
MWYALKMQPHPRIRRTIKWGGAAVSVLLVAGWIASARACFSVVFRDGSILSLCSGQVLRIRSSSYLPWQLEGLPKFRAAAVRDQPFQWRTTHVWSPAGNVRTTYDGYPLWPLPLACVLVTAAAWRLDTLARRRERAGRCPNCRYDRTGLAAGAVCPECGAGAAGGDGGAGV